MYEIETKVLEVNAKDISKKIESLGARKIQDVTLKVDWFSLPENPVNKQPYFLRVRSYSTGKVEITWKGDVEVLGTSLKAREINVKVDDHDKIKMLFEAIGFVVYAHQEKKRISWKLNDFQFDLDTYPSVPTYLEIEASSEEDINKMIKNLNLGDHETWNDGERTLIEGKYKLDWRNVRF